MRVYICEGGAQHSPRQRVVIYGVPYLLDIGSCMLENRELARAMEFDGEERSCEFHSNKEEVTKQTGDAAPVHLAAARLRATLAPRPLSAPTRRAGGEQAHHHQPHLHHRPLEPLDGTFPPTAASTTGPDRHRRQGHTGQQVLPPLNRNNFDRTVADKEVAYIFAGAMLGGRPELLALYTPEGRADCRGMAMTSAFIEGIDLVEAESLKSTIALMCSEKDPVTCYCALLAGHHLHRRGHDVRHILADHMDPELHSTLLEGLMRRHRIDDAGQAVDAQSARAAYQRRD